MPDSRGREKNRVGTKDEKTRQAGGGGWGSQEKERWVCAYFSVLLVLTPGAGITQPFPSSAVRRHCHPLITCTHGLPHRRQPATGDNLSLFGTESLWPVAKPVGSALSPVSADSPHRGWVWNLWVLDQQHEQPTEVSEQTFRLVMTPVTLTFHS